MKTTKISELQFESEPYFSGFGNRSLGTSEPTRGLVIEKYNDADGETTYTAYRPAAMRRAAARSIRAGGGVRGICSEQLRDREKVAVTPDCTVGAALELLREGGES